MEVVLSGVDQAGNPVRETAPMIYHPGTQTWEGDLGALGDPVEVADWEAFTRLLEAAEGAPAIAEPSPLGELGAQPVRFRNFTSLEIVLPPEVRGAEAGVRVSSVSYDPSSKKVEVVSHAQEKTRTVGSRLQRRGRRRH